MGSELPAAETTLLDLDESKFRRRRSSYPKIDEFAVFAKDTFRSYKQSNHTIDTFRLCLKSEWYGLSGFAAKWTSKALQLGATDLTFRLTKTRYRYPAIFIPFDEVLGAEHVVTLRLDNFRFYQRLDVTECSRLKSLTLADVLLSAESFFNVVSSCPLIENMSLSNVSSYGTHYGENGCEGERKVGRIPKGSTISLPKLTSLVLSNVGEPGIQNLFLDDDLSSKFPNLKELTLCLRLGEEEKHTYFISIHSLEILNFSFYDSRCYDYKQDKSQRVEFDVPSIRKFTFEGQLNSNVTFRSTSMDQLEESRVGLTRYGGLSVSWLRELSDFLKKLVLSKIHLCLHWHYEDIFDYQAGEIEGLDLVELEDLTMDTKGLSSVSFDVFLDGLFRICRPKMITQYASSRNSNDTFLCRALIGQEVQGKRLLIISKFMLCLLDLEDVKAQMLFGERWIRQPLNSILGDSERRFRFLLKWKPS